MPFFPKTFFWGTSTAAAQIETAYDHQWKGLKARDGYIFSRTIEHEKQRDTDLEYIRRFGKMYRCGVDWSRLQTAPFAPFDPDVVDEYRDFFKNVRAVGMDLMFVLHHFTNPTWFERNGSWLNRKNLPAFQNYVEQCEQHFGEFVATWNTFNEPNVYALNGWMQGVFPPHQKSLWRATQALDHMARAHNTAFDYLKAKQPDDPVGISLNTCFFKALHPLGYPLAKFTDWWFIWRTARRFRRLDYYGVSYYAYIPFVPQPLTELDTPGELAKRGIPHDKMWGYFPGGLGIILRKLYRRYRKPIVITENGICTDDPQRRIASIKDYLRVLHEVMREGVDIRGYIHWSTFDNFEWNLGMQYRFGLVAVHPDTLERSMTAAGAFYETVCQASGFADD